MIETIKSIQDDIRAGRFPSEASVSQGIVLRLLNELSWNIFDARVVWPEYALSGRRVDYALCHPPGKPAVFIEVKQVGQGVDAEKQLFEYAFHTGVPLAILTTGQEWHFFLPAGRGSYSERRVYKLDLLEREPSESAERLQRYLNFGAIASGVAIESARKDYESNAKDREIRQTLPLAWKQLVAEADEILIELLSEKVENLCGFRPNIRAVVDFLNGVGLDPLIPTNSASASGNTTKANVSTPPPRRTVKQTAETPGLGFTLNGESFRASSARGVLIQVFQQLAKRDATFLERFASRMSDQKRRRQLARSPEELYPASKHLAGVSNHYCELFPNSSWWLDLNLSRQTIERVIQIACDVAGLTFGKDLVITLK